MNLGYLEAADTPKAMLDELKRQTNKLMELEWKMKQAEEALENAKHEYDQFATVELPAMYASAGVTSLTGDDGTTVAIKTHYRASVKKGHGDDVAMFLRAHNADHLIKEELVVSQNDYEALKATGIPFREDATVNTNSLKAFLKAEIEEGRMSPTEIPQQAISWFMWNQAEVQRNG